MPEPIRYERLAPRPPQEGPIDLREAAPGDAPLELDIGFGRGMSLFARAERAPNSRLIGIEIKAKWATKVERRRARRGLGNVVVWAGDAREILRRCGPEGCVTRVFVHFPDPWWKKRHQKRRVLQPAFLDTLARLMADGGDLFVQTDVPDRHELYVRTVAEHETFAIVDAELDRNPFGAVSNRERRAEEDGLPVYRLLARRRPRG